MNSHSTRRDDDPRKDGAAPTQLDEHTLHKLNDEEHPEIAPHTCDFCQELCFGVDDRTRDLVRFQDGEEIVVTLGECIQRARRGCAFCSYMVSTDENLPQRSLKADVDVVAKSESWSISWSTNVENGSNASQLSMSRRLPNDKGEIKRWIREFQLYTAPETDRSAHGLTHKGMHRNQLLNTTLPPNLFPDSVLSEQRARRWLDECERSHQRCRAYQGTFRPKRLLEISHDGKMVRLQQDHAASPRYVTLSYCWGGDQPGKATTANVDALGRFFDTSNLPLSIRDGVKFAAKLQFRYIWVDVLCIVQDDDEDKGEQMAQMHRIYTSSTLTITAASASTSSTGFLQPRVAWKPILLNFTSSSGEIFKVLAVPAYMSHGEGDPHGNPLFTRAWAYQENQVSTRILSFGTLTMGFFCLETEQVDGGNPKMDLDVCGGRSGAAPGFVNAGMNNLASAKHPRAWTDLLMQYTRLGLSVPSDKLPALAALANEYGTRFSLTKYLAGLWWEDIHCQLAWGTIPTSSRSTSRPPVYCGPSWSWCSVVGDVDFPYIWRQPSHIERLCSVETASTTIRAADRTFDHVSEGKIILTGRVRKLLWQSVGGGFDRRLEVISDVPEEWPSGVDVTFSAIEIIRYRDQSQHTWRSDDDESLDYMYTEALLLHETEGAKNGPVYRRAGLLTVNIEIGKDADWFDERSTSMEVTII